MIFEAHADPRGRRRAIGRRSPRRAPPTAGFCYNDIVAMGATRALAAARHRGRARLRRVGFDDIVEAEHNAPPLTTVNADTRAMGARAAQSLLGMIDGARRRAACPSSATARLVVRESLRRRLAQDFKETV